MPDAFADAVARTLARHADHLPPGAPVDELSAFCAVLARANETINLTGIRTPGEMAVRHVLDSLAALPALSGRGALLDLGSGCGVPGIPLALARPERKVVLVESRRRKAEAIAGIVEALGLGHRVTAVRARGEDWLAGHRAGEIVTRAVGSVADQLALLSRRRDRFGRLVMLKGPAADEELEAAAPRLARLGFGTPTRLVSELPDGQGRRVVLVFAGGGPLDAGAPPAS